VRCFGYHPAKKTNLVPTEDLPWALTIHPLNTPNLYASPKVGEWVFGFFLDSLSAQEPAILGYLPAIPEVATEYFGTEPNLIRNFARVNTANNSANTICWEIGNNVVEIVTQSSTEANGHILIEHKTGAKVNIDSNGKISIYTPTNNISIEATNGDINLNAKNINLTASESITATSTLATSITAGGLASITAGGAFTATAGLYASVRALLGTLNLQSSSATTITAPSVSVTGLLEVAGAITGAASVVAPIIATETVSLGTHTHGGVQNGSGFTSTPVLL
jgi:hypothetical protein